MQLSACTSWFHSRFVHFDVISMTLYGRISGFVLLLVKTGFLIVGIPVSQRLHGNVCVLVPGSLPGSLIRLVH